MPVRFYERYLASAIRLGLFLVPVLPLYISSTMLFPFISGRNFAFRIIIELLVVLWAGLLVLSAEYRPRLSPLVRSVIVFLFVVTLADFLGANVYRSIWSNYERMEGLFMILHMVGFFFIILSVFREFFHWRWFIYASSIVSMIVAFIGILQKLGITRSFQGGVRVDSTIGNPTYLASYLMMHAFLLIFLLFREKTLRARWVISGMVLFQLFVIYLTATRGVILAILAVTFLISLAFIFHRQETPLGRRLRLTAAVLLVGGVIFVGAFWALRDTAFVRESPVLSRFASLSFQERTIQSRFLIWNIAWQGVKERPILGWGQENFYLLFNKYFDPKLWNNEPWFDRSHNIIFDWLVHAGVLGLLAYLAMLVFGIRNIWQAFRRNAVSYYEAVILAGLILAYFLQNLFVFDNFQTYFLILLALGLTEYLAEGPRAPSRPATSLSMQYAWVTMGVLLALVGVGVYFVNVKPILASQQIIQGLYENGRGSTVKTVESRFQNALSYNTFGSGEGIEQMASIARSAVSTQRGTPEELKMYIDFAARDLETLSSGPAADAKHLLFLGSIYNAGLILDGSYAGRAIDASTRAMRLAPRKQQIYFELANTYVAVKDYDHAIEALKKAVEFEPSFPQAHMNLAVAAIVARDMNLADEELKRFRSLTPQMGPEDLQRLIYTYASVNELGRIRPLVEEAIRLEPTKGELYGQYAALLAMLGDVEGAIAAAEKAAELNPQLKAQVDQFIKEVKSGTFKP